MNIKKLLIVLGGLMAIVGHFIDGYYLALIGGALAMIVAFTLNLN
jgi:hypothetical protein